MSIESEHADMKARLAAIAKIVLGGDIPPEYAPPKASTPGCNCAAEGNANPEAHQFGCPYGPTRREPGFGGIVG